jgi:ribosomal protein L37E
MRKDCDRCGRITEHSKDGYCLVCSNPVKDVFDKRIAQYIEWTGDKEWQYDASTYWQKAWEMMYRMVIAGRPVSEIALEFDTSENNIKARVREYCKNNNLESPFRKNKKPERKPNGKFCLACNRPLVGNQRKWCDNEDCGGWNDLHPRIVRQCPVCRNITATYAGSGYETVCQGCTNFPEDAEQRTKEWIDREKESVEFTKEMRAQTYDGMIWDSSTECNEDVFFGYLKIDFNRRIIAPIGKKAEDMFEIVRDIRKVWELCKPKWSSDVLKKLGFNNMPSSLMCPVYSPSLKGPNGISCLLAPFEDWMISVDMSNWWFNIQGELVTFLTMKFSDWLKSQYLEKERDIEEIANDVITTIYRVEYALNELSITLRKNDRRPGHF